MNVDVLGNEALGPAETFVSAHPAGLFYHQAPWRAMIAALTSSEGHQVIARDGDEVRGWCPVFVKDGPLGPVANSSPFFGSHGGILAANDDAFRAVAAGLKEFLSAKGAGSLNIIEPLLETRSVAYAEALPVALQDRRVGHVKNLSGLDEPESLLGSVHGLVRSNLKRKAWRSELQVAPEATTEALNWLADTHIAEMSARVGGTPKPRRFFELVSDMLAPDREWRLYTARRDGEIVAGLLLFYWREYVEYITPAFAPAARALQALSALIFQAMVDAARAGYRVWDFGGSWPSQAGVQEFKDSWGGTRTTYRYHIVDLGGLAALRAAPDRGALMAAYPGYYLYPFD